jgi:hypothetical protein
MWSKYTVEFNLFGKQLRAKVKAESKEEAKRKVLEGVKKRVLFTGIIKEPISDNSIIDFFNDIFK